MESHLAPALFPALAWDLIRRNFDALPVVPTAILECRLHADPRVDFSLQFPRWFHDWAKLAEQVPALAPLARFSPDWQSPGGAFFDGLQDLWVEFDFEHSGVPAASLFLTLLPGFGFALDHLVQTVAAEFGYHVPTAAARTLARLVESLPAGCEVLRLGLWFGRKAETLRVEIDLPAAKAGECLAQCGWPGDVAKLMNAFEPLIPLTRKLFIALDLDATVGRRVGLLCSTTEAAPPLPRWAAFLESLTAEGLCLPAKRDALLAWTGGERQREATDPWKLALGVSKATLETSLHTRAISHVKLDYEEGKFTQAKGYLVFKHFRENENLAPQ